MNYPRDLEVTLYIYLVSNFGSIMAIATLYSLLNPLTEKLKKMHERSVDSVFNEKETIHK